jgi:Fe2+ or Zn2+ uptake regulation protein
MKSSAELVERFRSEGLRITAQREQIFDALVANRSHPTAEAVWAAVRERMPAVSLKTVYETLHELVALGELQQIDLGLGARKYDVNVDDHHHLVCLACGKIEDLHADFSTLLLPPEIGTFEVASVELVFRGLCGSCRDSEEEEYIH